MFFKPDLKKPLLMGILNITPDSFSDGGAYFSPDLALEKIKKLIASGADTIDIGAESTRPGAELLDDESEWFRLKPLLKRIAQENIDIPISIDTRKAIIAEHALKYGAEIINDVSGLADLAMIPLLSKNSEALLVLNHHRGIPPSKNQNFPANPKIMQEVIEFFEIRLEMALQGGMQKSQFILDPGLGFGKNLEENILILRNLPELKKYFKLPVLIGPSRKRFVRQLWKDLIVEDSLSDLDWASSIISLFGCQNGADLIRCHEPSLYKPLKELF